MLPMSLDCVPNVTHVSGLYTYLTTPSVFSNVYFHNLEESTITTLIDRFVFMVFNTIFNNISVISWWSVLLVEETRAPRENYQPVTSHWQNLLHNIVHLDLSGFELTTSVMIGTDCTGSCKSNYHMIMTMTALQQ